MVRCFDFGNIRCDDLYASVEGYPDRSCGRYPQIRQKCRIGLDIYECNMGGGDWVLAIDLVCLVAFSPVDLVSKAICRDING